MSRRSAKAEQKPGFILQQIGCGSMDYNRAL
jgi:hypothetical protein